MNVEFCNSKAFKIDSDDLKEKVMLQCDLLFGYSLKRGYFPGPQPVAVEKKDFEKLKNEEYMVCEKSDGERAILLLININNKPMCFIINRNNDLYFMDLSFKKEVFEGTVMDGELIKTKNGEWNYLIHDCMIYNGTNFTEMTHRLRYACIIDFILKRYVNKKTDCVNIKTKIFYKYGVGIDKTWKHIQETTENEIDGLIFTPVNKPIKFGRDYSLLKWKELHTIDFLVTFKNKKIQLYYLKQNENILFKTFATSNPCYKKITEFIKEKKIIMDSPIIEFKIIGESYIPYRFRSDKKIPNGEITVQNTLKNIEENITISDFIESFIDINKLSLNNA